MNADLFADEAMPERFSMQAQIRCVEREVAMRERVYPRLVYAGKISAPRAEEELACMRQVLRTLKALVHTTA